MIHAHEHIRPMRGGSQAQLFSDDNGGQWAVKFLNNPQHPRVLANEWIASSLARALGLSVPDFDIMDVAADVIERHSWLAFRHGGRLEKPVAGPAFASRLRNRASGFGSRSRQGRSASGVRATGCRTPR